MSLPRSVLTTRSEPSSSSGGIFSLPPFLSADARHLLSRMLLVDSNKRIKLHEIRQLPWFQKDLPPHLFAPAPSPAPAVSGDEDPDAEPMSPTTEGTLWTPQEEQEGLTGRRREWVAGLGVVDQEIVDDLCSKIAVLKSDDVWATLKVGKDKELRIAYQLCRDNKRMVEGCELNPWCCDESRLTGVD